MIIAMKKNKTKNKILQMKTFNFTKEQQRGTLKQVMRVRGLRTISLINYINWKNGKERAHDKENNNVYPVASLKLNLQDGYLNLFDDNNNKIENEVAAGLYNNVYNLVTEIFEKEDMIPYKFKRNILVKINR